MQVQELHGQNDEADTNTHDFKQILMKLKHEFETLSTTWRVKFFLQFREGITKKPKLL